MKTIRNVCIYARVSTEEQATEGYSISAQLNILKQYAQLNGWHVVNEYVDEGISGKSIRGRPSLNRLIDSVSQGKFDAVLVWKISRLSRNMLETLLLLDQFEKENVKFISYSENFDSGTPIGRLVIQLMASIAEMERNTLSENVKLGMKQRALEGSWNGGVIFGYDSYEKELVINNDEAEVVKMIFEMYQAGNGLKALANSLNKRGYRTKRNKHFSINGIAQILDNPTYVGKIRWLQVEDWDTKRRKGKNLNPILVEGKHEAIIGDELWSLVESRRKSRSFKQRQSSEPFLLSSILRCPDCDQGMVPSTTTSTKKDGTKKKHRYYVCSNFHNKGSSACKSNGIRAYDTENALIERIQFFVNNEIQFNSKIIDLNTNSVQSVTNLKNEMVSIENRLSEVKTLQTKYLDAFEQSLFPISILQERMQQVEDEKIQLEQKKDELGSQLGPIDTKAIPPAIVRTLLEKFLKVYEASTRDKRKQLLQLLISTTSVKQQKDYPRSINEINLDFDFTEVNSSKTFILIHLLYREDTGVDVPSSLASNTKTSSYLQLFLPLFMVRFPLNNPKPSINLLHQHQLHQLMRKCHLRKR
ncbi:recombinase family protein [Sporosarcina sp. P26b]|uniref:recombinase family protein n=1 Tax=Sporosarcina sp. P26b TaxID=2048253 RepID=UPI001E3C84E0|nr:recombinase family protein [Sporosarcina sp. P26b]